MTTRRSEPATEAVPASATASAPAPCTAASKAVSPPTVAYDNKGKTGQWTGFYLTKYAEGGSPAFSSTELPVWNSEAVYGDVDYSGAVTTLGDVKLDRLAVRARREPG